MSTTTTFLRPGGLRAASIELAVKKFTRRVHHPLRDHFRLLAADGTLDFIWPATESGPDLQAIFAQAI